MKKNTIKNIISAVPSLVIPLLGLYGTIVIYENHKLKKNTKTRLQHLNQYERQGYCISNSSQIMNKYNTIPSYHNVSYVGKEIIKPYMEQLQRVLGPDIRIANHNFSTLKLEKTNSILKTGAHGVYEGTKNIIQYVKNNSIILGHEVLHMASYMYDRNLNIHYHGFMQQKNKTILCTGLNEGYTELLNARIFNNGKVHAYPRLVRIVKLLEEFFPNPRLMAHYYFTCNLPAFLQNLRQYCTEEEIKEILHGLDRLYEYAYAPANPEAVILETQLASKLYTIYERNFAYDPAKVQAFKNKVGENKLSSIAINNQNYKLTKTNPFIKIKNSIQKGFRKIKNYFAGPQPQPAYTR